MKPEKLREIIQNQMQDSTMTKSDRAMYGEETDFTEGYKASLSEYIFERTKSQLDSEKSEAAWNKIIGDIIDNIEDYHHGKLGKNVDAVQAKDHEKYNELIKTSLDNPLNNPIYATSTPSTKINIAEAAQPPEKPPGLLERFLNSGFGQFLVAAAAGAKFGVLIITSSGENSKTQENSETQKPIPPIKPSSNISKKLDEKTDPNFLEKNKEINESINKAKETLESPFIQKHPEGLHSDMVEQRLDLIENIKTSSLNQSQKRELTGKVNTEFETIESKAAKIETEAAQAQKSTQPLPTPASLKEEKQEAQQEQVKPSSPANT